MTHVGILRLPSRWAVPSPPLWYDTHAEPDDTQLNMQRGIYNQAYSNRAGSDQAMDEIVTKAVALHNNSNVDEAIGVLTEGLEQFPEAAELLWRRARWRCVVAETIPNKEEVRALYISLPQHFPPLDAK